MNVDGKVDKQLLELEHRVQDESKRDEDGFAGEQQDLVGDDQLNENSIAEDGKDGCEGATQASAVLQMPEEQPQERMVYWERFLHLRSLKVLLVENDDSTRHVVAALLRYCCYEVTEATNGLQAWKVQKEMTNHIDLVLTEVVMPYSSGIALLGKIMSHKTRKNLPVIKLLDKTSRKVDSPRTVSPYDRLAECPDSTCAQVIYSNAKIADNRRVPVTAVDCQEHEEQCENITKRHGEMDIGVQQSLDLQIKYQNEAPIKLVCKKQIDQLETGSPKFSEQIDRGQLGPSNESSSGKLKCEAANLAGAITKIIGADKEITEYEASNETYKIVDMNSKSTKDPKELLPLELSLKRQRGVNDIGPAIQDDRFVLRRSNSSAFSRYNTASNAKKASCGKVAIASKVDVCFEVTKKGLECDIQSYSNGDPLNQSSNEGSNNMDMGSTTNNAFIKPVGLKNKSKVSSNVNCVHSSSLQPIKNDLLCSPQQVLLDKKDDLVASPVLALPRSKPHDRQVYHLGYHNDNCHLLVHNMQQQQLRHDHDQFSLEKMAEAVPHCGSSNMMGGFVEHNAGNYSVNGSASGSNHGSNGQNGSSTAVTAGGLNVESDNGVVGKSGSGDASGQRCGSGNRIDKNKFALREAALTKFRQKRKARCFRKKVRYQNRKRLAEQRPRVRGQFVRRTENENISREPET